MQATQEQQEKDDNEKKVIFFHLLIGRRAHCLPQKLLNSQGAENTHVLNENKCPKLKYVQMMYIVSLI